MPRPLALILTMILETIVRSPISGQAFSTLELHGGYWFDGTGFQVQSKFVVAGRLTGQRPDVVDRVIDLEGLYVLPPFGDAHTHHFDSPRNTRQLVAQYIKEGTFYAKTVTEPRSNAMLVRDMVNAPASVDVSYAHGGLTSSFSHPIEVYEAVALGFMTYEQQRTRGREIRASRLRDGDAYFTIDSADDLERKWPQILAGRPDFIKIYLRDAECYAETGWPKNPGVWDFEGGGLAPELVPVIVKHAQQAGLRVTAAVNTTFDLHVALASGVNEISHLPGYQSVAKLCAAVTHAIPTSDAMLAADHRVDMVLIANEYLVYHPPAVGDQLRANIRTLRDAGVTLTIGSDSYGASPMRGVLQMSRDAVLPAVELLRIWSMNTPRAIFPNRSVGCLDDGCEASVVALGCNPLEDFSCVTNIHFRMKDGRVMETSQ